ncbi:conserved hypothetical protein [Hyphomonas neptunium ATCC 15444]|uniref:SnoaL-like domain-containing protein n=2 Tax=Hyphomonas TaxID=85 RepID=Q0C2L0_HYPNA|nr:MULTISPECIES: hypothetical protein [Hyphomonas]ABI78507.1 conserved hypothetical protein [Hyphomonas neptunium ATCC 15444]KCZ95732.1 hypothetical protein HHI_03137 [Hyphomonas hirschiana VP5]
MPETREGSLRRFFQQYAKASLDGDTATVAASYAPTYIESSPTSFAAWKVDDAYRKALDERHAVMHGDLGLEGLDIELQSIEEVAPSHYLVTANRKMAFARGKSGPVTSAFPVTYVVKVSPKPEILAYMSRESEEAVMRRDGVI